jgi:hypothetical protein
MGQSFHHATYGGCYHKKYEKVLLKQDDEVGRVFRMNGEKRNTSRILVGKPEAKRPPGRPGHRWVENIKMDLEK